MKDFTVRHSNFEIFLKGKQWRNYSWGLVVEVFKVGNYGILKYISNIEKEDVNNKVLFHPFILSNENMEYHENKPYWRDTCTSYYSLESALIGAITYKFEGANSQAGSYFCKMIGLE